MDGQHDHTAAPQTGAGPHGPSVLMCSSTGPALRDVQTALDLIGDAMGHRAETLAVPVELIADDFFSLRSGLAGDIVQKFTTYGIRLVIVGDIAPRLAESPALRDFVREANRGRHVWFVETREELDERLRQRSPSGRAG